MDSYLLTTQEREEIIREIWPDFPPRNVYRLNDAFLLKELSETRRWRSESQVRWRKTQRRLISMDILTRDPYAAKDDRRLEVRMWRDMYGGVLREAAFHCPPLAAGASLPSLSDLTAVRKFLLCSVQSWWQGNRKRVRGKEAAKSYGAQEVRFLPDGIAVSRRCWRPEGIRIRIPQFDVHCTHKTTPDELNAVVQQWVEEDKQDDDPYILCLLQRRKDWRDIEAEVQKLSRFAIQDLLLNRRLPNWPSMLDYLCGVRDGVPEMARRTPRRAIFVSSFLITNGGQFGVSWGSQSRLPPLGFLRGSFQTIAPHDSFGSFDFYEKKVLPVQRKHCIWLRKVAATAGVKMDSADLRLSNSRIGKQPVKRVDDITALRDELV